MGLTQKLGTIPLAISTDASNNVGIGGSPSGSYKLEVTGTSRVSGAALFSSSVTIPSSLGIILGTTGSTDGIISSVSGTVGLRFKINTTDALVIASSGAATFSSSVDGTIFNSTSNAFRFSGSNALSLVTLNSQNVVKVNAAGYWGVQLVGANDQGIVINNTGLVGIGTTAPLKILHLAKGGNDNGILFTDDAAGNYRNEINNTYSGAAAASNLMTFKVCNATTTGQTTAMTLNGAGNVIVGKTSDNGAKFQVFGKTQMTGTSNDSGSSALYCENNLGTRLFEVRNDGANFVSLFTYNNTVSGGVRSAFIDNGGALGGINSIRKSKKNIQEFNCDWIYNLKPVQFNYRKKDEQGNFTEEIYDELAFGLIAEDTEPIADFLINYNDKEDGTKEMIGIEYSRLITPMLQALQELSAQNQDLKSRLDKAGL